jgi:hypothetical protein
LAKKAVFGFYYLQQPVFEPFIKKAAQAFQMPGLLTYF